MKIAQLLYSGFGGTATVAFSLVDASDKIDWSMLFYGVEPLEENYRKRCAEKGIGCQFYHKKRVGFFDNSNYKKIEQALTVIAPDAIICHLPSLVFIARKYCNKNPLTKLVAVEHHALHLKKTKDWILSLLLMRQADKVVYLSEFYRDKIKEKIGKFFKEEKAAVVPNGVNTQIFKPIDENKLSPIFAIGMMGRLVDGKDFETIIKAVALLNNQGEKIQFLIAGDGPKMQQLENLVSEKRLENSVVFLGWLAEDQLIEYLNGLDVYIHSTAGETINTSVMQAMAMELPVLVSDVPEVNKMVIHGVSGFLFEKGDANELAEQLMLFMSNKNLIKVMGKQARGKAIKDYSAVRMLAQYIECFGENVPA